MTYGEALDMGYRMGDIKYQRGYVSRRVDVLEQPVKEAGGSRKGELYVLIPNRYSTNYCYRQYLVPRKKSG